MPVDRQTSPPAPRRLPGWARVTLVTVAIGGLAWAAGATWSDWQQRRAGERLFDGRRPLVGQLLGHAQPLPPQAARCINCHGASAAAAPVPAGQAASAGGAGIASGERLAPVLTSTLLRRSVARRGGPASHYEAASFCRLLRTGIDPAWVMLPRSMPRYQISDSDCQQLWAYLAG